MNYCITFIMSNPCLVLLYLQLAAKLTTAAGPRASSGEESDDGTAGVIKVLAAAASTMSSSLRLMSCPPELTRPPSVPTKTKSSTVQTGGTLRERELMSLASCRRESMPFLKSKTHYATPGFSLDSTSPA